MRRRITDLRFEISKLKTRPAFAGGYGGPANSNMNETKSRMGMIAHFEKEVRDEISRMIWDGKSYPKIITAMGAKGIKLNKGVLTTWRQGGYQDWMSEQEQVLHLGRIREFALQVVKETQGTAIQEAGMQVAAGQVYEMLTKFDAQVLREKFGVDAEGYTKLVNVMARLGDGALRYEKYRAEVEARKERILRELEEGKREGMTKARFARIERNLNLT